MTRRDALVGLVAAGALGVGGCNPFPATCRMRLTLVLETPLGRRTGSSVVQVKAHEIIHFAGTNRFRATYSGEAIVIPLENDVVFGVMEERIFNSLIHASLSENERGEEYLDEIRRVRAKAAAQSKYDLSEEDWPSLVRFADRNVPESIQAVCMNLDEPSDYKPAGYKPEEPGPCSVRIMRATVTPTRDRITRGVLNYLPWLTTRHGSMVLNRSRYLLRPEQRLTNSDFLSGLDGQF